MRDKVGIRIDCSNEIGTGHFKRALAIRDYLNTLNVDSELVFGDFDQSLCEKMDRNDIPYKIIRRVGFEKEIQYWKENSRYYSLILFDISHKKTWKHLAELSELIAYIKLQDTATVFLDGCGPEMCANHIDLDLDLLIVPYECESPKNIHCPVLIGAKYFIFNKDYLKLKPRPCENVKNILFTFGGSDPTGISLIALDVISALQSSKKYDQITFKIVIGEAFSSELTTVIENNNSVKHIQAPDNLCRFINEADIVICATGLTKYEVLLYRKPGIHISINQDLAKINKTLAHKGCCIDLGEQSMSTKDKLKAALDKLVDDYQFRNAIINNTLDIVDGKGGMRVAASLKELANSKRSG